MKIKRTIITAILLSISMSSYAFASSYSDCYSEPLSNLNNGSKVAGFWRVKKGAYCESTFRVGTKGETTRPIEIVSAPKECKVITNKMAVAITCNKIGEYNLVYRWHKKDSGIDGYVEIRRNLTVFE
mgnify:CR=1 FL=1